MQEGDWARFCCRVTGHPRPRVMWLINGNTVVSGSRYKLTYDGMYHMDIPKTRQYDSGKVEVIARSSVGEAIAETELKIIPRHDDYRGVLKNSPRRKLLPKLQNQIQFTKILYTMHILPQIITNWSKMMEIIITI